MASVTELDPSAEQMALTSEQRPQPLGSLTAAARRLTSKELKRRGHSKNIDAWQEDAWEMYDLVGEQRFLASTLANRLAQARFYVGKLPQNTTEEIEPVENGPAYDAFDTLVGKGSHFTQMIQRLGVNLFIPGDGYLVGIPEAMLNPPKTDPSQTITPIGAVSTEIDIQTLQWRMMSVSEVDIDPQSGQVKLKGVLDEPVNPDLIMMIRVWRPHPRRFWSADSPTRSSLPVLRELVGLTMHISAQVDSRLAGAGVLFVPSSADTALRAASGQNGTDGPSPFAEGLMEAMVTPIGDRSNASAVVPLMPVVPDESIEKFRYISFATELDKEARELRDEAIRRLALGQDCPPELLLGVSGMNHWGAWLVREDVVTTHLEPPLALMCDAITTQFLWPVLEEQGVQDYQDYVVWNDVSHLILRPNRADDAFKVHESGALSDAALRDAAGFDESDAPPADPNDPVTKLILDMIRQAPSLVQNPGLSAIAEQVRALVEGQPIPENPVPERVNVTEQEAPGSEPKPAPPPPKESGPPAEEGTPQ